MHSSVQCVVAHRLGANNHFVLDVKCRSLGFIQSMSRQILQQGPVFSIKVLK